MSFTLLPATLLLCLVAPVLAVELVRTVLRVERTGAAVAGTALLFGVGLWVGAHGADGLWIGAILTNGAAGFNSADWLPAMVVAQFLPPVGMAVVLAGLWFALHRVVGAVRAAEGAE